MREVDGRHDHLSPAQRSRAMARVRRRDTAPEIAVRRGMWRAGLRGWRCDLSTLPGRPDVAFTRWRVAVFVDGLLWHGHPKRYPANLNGAWREKIARNVRRDRETDALLSALGWRVLRVWDSDVQRNCPAVISRIVSALAEAGAPIMKSARTAR
jgi:DNA mismatch endonuclease (patch repair protein)